MRRVDFNYLITQVLPKTIRDLLTDVGGLSQRTELPVYLVGGIVRDLILRRPNLDVDLVVEGDGLFFAQELAKSLCADIRIYEPFLTATITPSNRLRIDVATARREKYLEPAGLPQVKPATIQDDLQRRDFTINSLALRIRKTGVGKLLDPLGGCGDIGNGLIRVLHDASFTDDPTRIFRAIRYQVRFGFRLDDLTLKLLRKSVSAGMVERLSGERIRNELWLLFEEEEAPKALHLLDSLGVLSHIHPSLKFSSRVTKTLTALRNLFSEHGRNLRADIHLASLFSLLEAVPFDSAVEIARRLSLNRRELERTLELKLSMPRTAQLSSEGLTPSKISSLLRGLCPELLLFDLARAENEIVRERITRFIVTGRKVKLRIAGKDLKALGIPEGPLYQEILARVLDAKIDGLVDTREEELSLAQKVSERLAH